MLNCIQYNYMFIKVMSVNFCYHEQLVSDKYHLYLYVNN